MRPILFAAALAVLAAPASALAQRPKSDDDFVKAKPAVGDPIPELTVYDPSGKEVKTSALRGQYTVLVFGCLT